MLILEKHEVIANEENEAVRRSSKVFSASETPNAPKGHVPTRTVSFNENDTAKVAKTKQPPMIAVKPIFIVPASSELPDEEVVFEINQVMIYALIYSLFVVSGYQA